MYYLSLNSRAFSQTLRNFIKQIRGIRLHDIKIAQIMMFNQNFCQKDRFQINRQLILYQRSNKMIFLDHLVSLVFYNHYCNVWLMPSKVKHKLVSRLIYVQLPLLARSWISLDVIRTINYGEQRVKWGTTIYLAILQTATICSFREEAVVFWRSRTRSRDKLRVYTCNVD